MPTFHSNRFGYAHFCFQVVANISCFSATPIFGYAHSAKPIFKCFRLRPLFFWICFSAMPFFRLCPLGYAHCIFRLCPLFFWSHFSAMPFVRLCPLFFWSRFRLCLFSAMPAIVFYICVFYFPPLYANRSNAIGGEGRFFYVFYISARVYNLSVQRS